jgi:hypothetical protein
MGDAQHFAHFDCFFPPLCSGNRARVDTEMILSVNRTIFIVCISRGLTCNGKMKLIAGGDLQLCSRARGLIATVDPPQ